MQDYKHISIFRCLLTIVCLDLIKCQNMRIINQNILPSNNDVIYNNGILSNQFNSSTYKQNLNCRNGDLVIFNNTQDNKLVIQHDFISLNQTNVLVNVQPHLQPYPQIQINNQSTFKIVFNCPTILNIQNYYNKVTVKLINYSFQFDFLLNCGPKKRFKQFQLGYLVLSVINAVIMIGVSMFSHIWSINYKNRPLKINLNWVIVLVGSLLMTGLLFGFYFFAMNYFLQAFLGIRYAGIIVSFFFVYICCNQILFLFAFFKQQIKNIKIYYILGFIISVITTVLAFLYQNWVFYNFLAGFICVGSIKLFNFRCLKQAYITMGIIVLITTIDTAIIHFILPDRSYNDYATELSSPFFIMMPDLVYNLYKKCSWIPVLDIVIPGVMLSYLRMFDKNRGSKWGGVYTVWGNIIFVLATITWIFIQAVYPFSVPFNLVTYSIMILAIFLISYTRNQWKMLAYGTFLQQQIIPSQCLQSPQKVNITSSIIDPLKIHSESSHISEQS